ncbi:MAG: cupredoxin domain-containing protein [Gammaproteobacteria bacterium]|jgi:plastocyanin domain-containing protein|nr:cupredoxin domain-containing protein [Gammaproteobacteria bacterium]MBY0543984.1 cupredoxin domain-containing protein [Gammaproteobacteria bacterium]
MILFIAVNGLGLLFMALIIKWFWFSTPVATKINKGAVVTITVKDGTYQPAYIEASAGSPITLRFTREDASPCAEVVIFSALNINQQLPLHQAIDIVLTIDKPGSYEFTCQMGMYRGKLVLTPSV